MQRYLSEKEKKSPLNIKVFFGKLSPILYPCWQLPHRGVPPSSFPPQPSRQKLRETLFPISLSSPPPSSPLLLRRRLGYSSLLLLLWSLACMGGGEYCTCEGRYNEREGRVHGGGKGGGKRRTKTYVSIGVGFMEPHSYFPCLK